MYCVIRWAQPDRWLSCIQEAHGGQFSRNLEHAGRGKSGLSGRPAGRLVISRPASHVFPLFSIRLPARRSADCVLFVSTRLSNR